MRSLWTRISLPSFLRRTEPSSPTPCQHCESTPAARVPAPTPAVRRPVAEPFTTAEWDQVVRAAAVDKIEQVLSDSYALLSEHTLREPADSPDLRRVRRIRTSLTALSEDLGSHSRPARGGERAWIESELLPTVLGAEVEIGRLFAGLR
ncbi:hypothetical protein [Nocardiopsis sp. FIRDI 009]|uniref:hypothetical protein n=1 Tax=Nocardiopsis sp. FIRDI 009 TaxID=714197 RepID=UPI000E25EB62|nr:hypothetical protein [Nocardiopsis sp. FIRDI 009]